MPLFSSFSASSARSLGLTSGAPPGPPVITSDSSTATTLTIGITPVLGSFEISRFEYSLSGAGYTGNISGSATTFQFTGLVPSTSYTVRIRAVDASGQISDVSNQITRSTTAEIPPSAPSVSLAQLESSTGTPINATYLNWSYGVASAGTYPVTSYQYTLYRGATLVTDWAAVPMAPNTNYTLTGLTPATSYTVYVRGVATANGTTYGSNGSATATTDTEILNSAPSVTINSETTTTVTFTRGTSLGGTYGVSYYDWVVVRNSDGATVNSGTTTNTSLTVNAGVSPDQTFTVYVRARSLTSNNPGAYGTAAGQLDPEVPAAPSIYFSSESASERGTAYLAWGAVQYATQYQVFRNGVHYDTTSSTSYNVPVSAGGSWSFFVRAGNRSPLNQFSGNSNTKSMATGSTGVPWSMTTGATSPVRYFGTTVSCDSYIGSLKINIGSVPTSSSTAGYKYIQTIGYEVASIPGSTLAYTSVSNRRLYFMISGVTQTPPSGWEAWPGVGTIIRREVPGRGLDTNFALDYYENGVNLGGANISNTAVSVTPDGVNWADYVTCQENVVDNINTSIRGRNLYITGYQTTATTYG